MKYEIKLLFTSSSKKKKKIKANLKEKETRKTYKSIILQSV